MSKKLLIILLLILSTSSFGQFEVLSQSEHSVSWLDELQFKPKKTIKSQSLASNEASIVGEYIKQAYSSPSPYLGNNTSSTQLVWTDVIHYASGTYISPYFSMMDLGPDDYVVLRSPDNSRKWVYRDQGINGQGTKSGFWGIPIHGNTAIVELYVNSATGGKGYQISEFARGYTRAEMGFDGESICTTDDTQEAKCYMNSEPEVYEKARAVVRILSNGNAHCTGWLVGDEGHILTNEHCVTDQSSANNLTLELMAEGADCATNCSSALGCPGIVEATGPTFITDSGPLDYALLMPTNTVNDLPTTYGFMQLRATGAVLNEQIYIPQHPAGWGKRVAFSSSYPDDVNNNNGLGTANSISEAGCSGPEPDVGYWLDTQGGSSGSPVLGYSDHKIVALHHCRGSASCTTGNSGSDDPNRGVPIQAIIADLGANLPNGAVCDSPDAPTNVNAVANGDNQIDVSWSSPGAGSFLYDVYRAVGNCSSTTYEKIATGVSGTTYVDTDVSGTSEYAYKVKTYDTVEACTSVFSSCDTATATGICTLAPTFSGVEQVVNQKQNTCAVQVDWSQSVNNCGDDVVYNVYRSPLEEFTPSANNLVSSCETGTTFTDTGMVYGQDFYYSVQAEDNSNNGSGMCSAGNETSNLINMGVVATGPDNVAFSDDIDSGTGNWSTQAGTADSGTSAWEINTTTVNSAPNSWFVSDEPTTKDQLLILDEIINVSSAGLELRFNHNFNTEATWDGGVLEYTTDGGVTWFDILAGDGGSVAANPDRIIQNGYPSALRGGPATGRDAWSGTSSGWQQVVVSLSDFVGETVQFRWRMSCDGSVSGEGWYIDDVSVVEPTQCDFNDLIYADGFGPTPD
ncbi:trypsin-like peptidase domain-containing protein [Marinicella litoralis]|uniref:Immune inhibitor A peptidase M6 n=1 Tax=Marinicella litoralis TaxID=644220 RepID=A0A4R6XLA3_9GAMM|nr:trypsin-like peptidase domain-containing protein [Marinicella litoralis]TDR20382.1 immune inhibitor A peptidase M6 [Marinicella litoralis]